MAAFDVAGYAPAEEASLAAAYLGRAAAAVTMVGLWRLPRARRIRSFCLCCS